MGSLTRYERKKWSQHGEDGIIEFLTRGVPKTFIEIGAVWKECNSRNLIENGWDGTVYDARGVSGFPRGVETKVFPGFRLDESPGFFSLDIDSYDYFVADGLLRGGFMPGVVCVETNTFIPGSKTVRFLEPFSRYQLHPKFGLYFGCSLDAWRHLWGRYGYSYRGMDSSYTNAFFTLEPGESEDFGYQTYFCRKYGRSGEALTQTLSDLAFLEVGSEEYEIAFQNACAQKP